MPNVSFLYMVRLNFEELVKRHRNFVRLRKAGATYEQIGQMYGTSRQAVFYRVNKGFPKRREYEGGILKKAGFMNIKGRERSRMMVRIRDNFTCQDCGEVRMPEMVKDFNKDAEGLKNRIKLFDVHHTGGMCGKNSLGYDSVKDLSGLVTLCHRCHFNRPEHRCQAVDFRKKGAK